MLLRWNATWSHWFSVCVFLFSFFISKYIILSPMSIVWLVALTYSRCMEWPWRYWLSRGLCMQLPYCATFIWVKSYFLLWSSSLLPVLNNALSLQGTRSESLTMKNNSSGQSTLLIILRFSRDFCWCKQLFNVTYYVISVGDKDMPNSDSYSLTRLSSHSSTVRTR